MSNLAAIGRRLIHVARMVLDGLLVLYGVGLCLFTLFAAVDRSDLALIAFIKTGYRLALWPVPVLLVIYVLRRRWRIAALWLLPMLAFSLYYFPYLRPKSIAVPPDAPRLTVMTFNVLTNDVGFEDVARIITSADADIVGLQEFGKSISDYLSLALADAYPYQALNSQEGVYNYFRGQGFFSRYPILTSEYWQDTDLPDVHGNQRMVIDFHGTKVVVYNVHPWPPISWLGGLNFIVNPEEARSHHLTVQRLIERALAETSPVIVMGDFNMSDQFNEYTVLTGPLTDTFLEAGHGMGYTYPGKHFGPFPPVMRLDYVFHNARFQGVSAHVLSEHGPSDHFPVVATLALVD